MTDSEIKDKDKEVEKPTEKHNSINKQIEFLKENISSQQDEEKKEMLKAILKTLKAVRENYTNKNAAGYIVYVPESEMKVINNLLTNPNPPKQTQ